MDLRKQIIRLAHEHPELREHLLPILKTGTDAARNLRVAALHIKSAETYLREGNRSDREGAWLSFQTACLRAAQELLLASGRRTMASTLMHDIRETDQLIKELDPDYSRARRLG